MLRSTLTVLLALATALPSAFATETKARSLGDRVARLVSPGIRRIDKHLARIERKLPFLPALYNGPRGSRFGFHSETIANQDEPHHIQIDLGLGKGEARVWTCDLTHGYISINADYRS